MDADLLKDIAGLFQYRNRIAHCRIDAFQGKTLDFDAVQDLIESDRGPDLDGAVKGLVKGKADSVERLAGKAGKDARTLHFTGLSTEDLDAAEENLKTAERAIRAFRVETESDAWPVLRP